MRSDDCREVAGQHFALDPKLLDIAYDQVAENATFRNGFGNLERSLAKNGQVPFKKHPANPQHPVKFEVAVG
ncbi:MAG TPA: hypothetical protein VJG64_04755 [Candidatus Paceibacterota bacterium]